MSSQVAVVLVNKLEAHNNFVVVVAAGLLLPNIGWLVVVVIFVHLRLPVGTAGFL